MSKTIGRVVVSPKRDTSCYLQSPGEFLVILHAQKIIFIHIPKNAGSSIEKYFGVRPFDTNNPNYEYLTGWCPKRRLHLQHATPRQLLETDLVSEETWKTYYKFAVVRNSWERSLSDYVWMMRSMRVIGTFEEYLDRKGEFAKILSDCSARNNRCDHLIPQTEFTHIDKHPVLDMIIRFEALNTEFTELCRARALDFSELPHIKKGDIRQRHYSHYYTDKRRDLVWQRYRDDIEEFNFSFDDQRSFPGRLFLGTLRIAWLKYNLKKQHESIQQN